jgi:ferric-dicitrate binding protein FerR (iron transport regulator)
MEKEDLNEGIYSLLIRCLSGEASGEENVRATQWIEASSANRQLYNSLRDSWVAASMGKSVDAETIEAIWQKISNHGDWKEDSVQKTKIIGLILRYAAMALIFMSLGGIIHYFISSGSGKPAVMSYTVEAPIGARAKLTLPDGTLVNLNAGSKLVYQSDYNFNDRVVTLSGEAFFNVAKDKTRPFRVLTSSMVVHALGTSFNVKAYPTEDRVETTLVEGSVKVEPADSKQNEHILKPNEKFTFSKTNKNVEVLEVRGETNTAQVEKKIAKPSLLKTESIESITSWKDNKLIFENEPLAGMVAKMRRWYGMDIYLNSVDSLNAKYSGKFIYNETIYQVLDILSRTTPIKYETRNHQIYIYNKND